MRKLFLVITGSRSEWFILKPVVQALMDRYQLKVVVTGSHLSRVAEYTAKFVEDDIGKDNIIYLHTYVDGDTLVDRAKTMANELFSFTDLFSYIQPKGIWILGDREETIAAATAAVYLNIPVIHLAGGDTVFGNVDDVVRHAVTKLSHLHFPFSKYSERVILQLGEEPWRVTFSGNPILDDILKTPYMSKKEVCDILGIPSDKELLVMIYHTISLDKDSVAEKVRDVLEAIVDFLSNRILVIIESNMDPGSGIIRNIYDLYIEKYAGRILVFNTLTRGVFVNLLRHAKLLVGNSSLGIVESPIYRIPVVNILPRQQGRLAPDNVIFVEPKKEAIKAVVERILSDDDFYKRLSSAQSIYGDGHAVDIIMDKISKINFDDVEWKRRLLEKKIIVREGI